MAQRIGSVLLALTLLFPAHLVNADAGRNAAMRDSARSCLPAFSSKFQLTSHQTRYGLVTEIKSLTSKTEISAKRLFEGSDRDLFLGLQEGHLYVIIGGRRFDGGVKGLIDSNLREGDLLTEGLFLRLTGLPASWIQGIEARINNPLPLEALNCSKTACNYIRDLTGSSFGYPGLVEYYPFELIKRLMEHRSNQDFTVEIYTYNTDFKTAMVQARRKELLIETMAISSAAVILVNIALGLSNYLY